ncbi:MAG: monovalent cation/H(+) antiporter subunit G [Planctomycetota bacterium]|nr:monovalent cation/H(+) antiporter subunit G [Planctomycetota bacterium]MDG2084390.1 monovalent cation/H(+) antiporter subunit G [Planctomycetota bacterium]
MLEYVADALMILGGFFAFSGSLGILRLPDFYSRLHPAGTSDTLGQLLILGGLSLKVILDSSGDGLSVGKLVAISLLLFVTTPASTHAISRVAQLSGIKPWTGADSKEADFSQKEEDTNE